MNHDAPETDGERAAQGTRRRTPLKFAYANGARPLEGYTIKRGIGAGGFGDVYYATSDGGKEVALKRIQRNLDVELRGVKQCLNLKHPNLLVLHDIRYDAEEQAWVVMEYVAGESLQDVIERYPQGLPRDEVQRWWHGIAAGVAYLHDHGIVHRDLKPGNIFMDQDTVKIGDYGLSKFISCSRRSGQTESVGTFHYMAPEIGLGRYGKEIDIYAMGILLYEMLTGHVPFEGESSQEIIMKHLTAEPRLDGVPHPYRAVIARALAKDPQARFSSIADMQQVLRDVSPPPLPKARVVAAETVRRVRDWSERPKPPEPLMAAVRNKIQWTINWWKREPIFIRAVTLIGAIYMGLISSAVLVPLLLSATVFYTIYYVIRSLVLAAGESTLSTPAMAPAIPRPQAIRPEPVMAQRVVTAELRVPPPPKRKATQVTEQELTDRLRETLARKSWVRHVSELLGSWIMSAVVVAIVSLVMVVLGTPAFDRHDLSTWVPVYTWLTVTSLVGSWVMLTLSKFWESTSGDQALRRFYSLVAGMGLGLLAGLVAQSLELAPIYPSSMRSWGQIQHSMPQQLRSLYDAAGQPHLLAYVGYFGALGGILRWWLLADPLRGHRVALWRVAATGGIAFGATNLLPIPHAFLALITMSLAVSLAAPWVATERRRLFRERLTKLRREADQETELVNV